MSTRYSAEEVRNIVNHIKVEAMQAGLIPMDAFMSYHPGNAANGISGHIDVFRQDEDGYHTIRVDFLPEFTYKMSKTDHAKLLDATLRVFFAMRRMREAAAPATEVTVYLTGTDEQDAQSGLLWENYEAAEEAADDSADDLKVYEVTARIDWSTISEAK